MTHEIFNEVPALNPNKKIILTPLRDGDDIIHLGYAAFGIFKMLQTKKYIDFEYLISLDRKGIDNQVNVLFGVYTLLFGHCKVFKLELADNDLTREDEEGYMSYFSNILFEAVFSKGNGEFIRAHLDEIINMIVLAIQDNGTKLKSEL